MQHVKWSITSCAMASLSSARFWRMRRADSRFVTRLQAITQVSSKNKHCGGTMIKSPQVAFACTGHIT